MQLEIYVRPQVICGRSLWKQKCFRDRVQESHEVPTGTYGTNMTCQQQRHGKASLFLLLQWYVPCSSTAIQFAHLLFIWCTAYNNPVVQHHHSIFLNIDSNMRVPDFRFKFGCHLFYGCFFSYKCSW